MMIAAAEPEPAYDADPISQDCWAYSRHIGVQLTTHCPLRCGHCIISAHEQSTEDMTDDTAEILRLKMSDCPELEAFSITGGEPFSRQAKLEDFCRYAKSRNLRLNVFTNAFWAKDAVCTSKTLDKLSGLSRIIISAGVFYSSHIPALNLQNAALAAIERGIEVRFRIFPGEGVDYLNDIKNLFNEPQRSVIGFSTMSVQARGRAADLPVFKNERKLLLEELPLECCGGLTSLSILYDGTITACTCFADPELVHPMKLGNIRNGNLKKIIRQADKDFFIHALRLWGTRGVLHLVADHSPVSGKRYSPNDPCGPCLDIFGNEIIMDSIRTILSQPKIQRTVALGRASRYGESSMLKSTTPF